MSHTSRAIPIVRTMARLTLKPRALQTEEGSIFRKFEHSIIEWNRVAVLNNRTNNNYQIIALIVWQSWIQWQKLSKGDWVEGFRALTQRSIRTCHPKWISFEVINRVLRRRRETTRAWPNFYRREEMFANWFLIKFNRSSGVPGRNRLARFVAGALVPRQRHGSRCARRMALLACEGEQTGRDGTVDTDIEYGFYGGGGGCIQ